MKILKTALVVFALFLAGTCLVPSGHADERDKKSIITVSTPFEIPGGMILPAGTYVFKLMDSTANRHVVQIWSADGTMLIANVLAINNYQDTPKDKSVILFSERPNDAPNAIKVWFFPGDKFGQEFVYPKERAKQLAAAGKQPVPALDSASLPIVAELNTTPLLSITPDQKEAAVLRAHAEQTAA